MFLRRIRLPLVGKHLKTAYQAHTGYGRIDHLVHVAQLGSPVGVGKLAAIVILQLFTPGFSVGSFVNLFAEKNVHRSIGAHHGYFGSRISQIHISPDVLGTHYIISSAISFTGNHRNLRHRSFTIGIKQLGTVADDAAILLIYPGRNPGTSTSVSNGILNASQKRTKRAALTEALISSVPANANG